MFTVIALSQLAHVLAIRSERESLFTQGLFSNTPLAAAVVLTVAMQMAVIYVPVLNGVFKTELLTAGELAVTFGVAALVFAAVEMEKWVRRTRAQGNGGMKGSIGAPNDSRLDA